MQETAISIIRNSLAAANAALSLLEVQPTKAVEIKQDFVPQHTVVVEQAPQQEVATPVEIPQTNGEILLNELNNPRFRLRTVSELAHIIGVTSDEVYTILDDADIAYVKKNRISDRAPLVGLASRN